MMHQLKYLLRRFQTKITLAMVLSMLCVLGLSNFLIYKFSLDFQFNSLRDKLKVIAQTAALNIDAQRIASIPLSQEGMNTPQYKIILAKLKKIKSTNPQIKYIYTMTKADEEGNWRFIVDADPILVKRDGVETAYPGDHYDASRFPEMLKAYFGPTADHEIASDEWGKVLSGYAPITDDQGQAIAVLGVDIAANDVYAAQQEVHLRGIFVIFVGILLSFVLGLVISKRMTDPVEDLVEATRHIGKGALKYQVKVKGDDEISELAHAFNDMAKRLHHSRKRILGYLFSVVRTLVRILELRDKYTRGHSGAVSHYAGQIAARMGFSQDTIKLFKRMTLLHDIGKLGIKDTILNKSGPLTEEEWEIMRKHPVIGEDILRPVLGGEEMLSIVRGHHERYDGEGYPDKLYKDKINIFAAIVSVADAYHAMTSQRSYRPALTKAQAIDELKSNRGTQFHPKVVDIFLEILEGEGKVSKRG